MVGGILLDAFANDDRKQCDPLLFDKSVGAEDQAQIRAAVADIPELTEPQMRTHNTWIVRASGSGWTIGRRSWDGPIWRESVDGVIALLRGYYGKELPPRPREEA